MSSKRPKTGRRRPKLTKEQISRDSCDYAVQNLLRAAWYVFRVAEPQAKRVTIALHLGVGYPAFTYRAETWPATRAAGGQSRRRRRIA